MTEKKPIVRLLFAKIKTAFNELSEEQRKQFMIKDRMNLNSLDITATMMIDCRWSNDEWDYIWVEEGPNKEAFEKRAKFENEELKRFKYMESKTYLGTGEIFEK